jgi:hypothetical protein
MDPLALARPQNIGIGDPEKHCEIARGERDRLRRPRVNAIYGARVGMTGSAPLATGFRGLPTTTLAFPKTAGREEHSRGDLCGLQQRGNSVDPHWDVGDVGGEGYAVQVRDAEARPAPR